MVIFFVSIKKPPSLYQLGGLNGCDESIWSGIHRRQSDPGVGSSYRLSLVYFMDSEIGCQASNHRPLFKWREIEKNYFTFKFLRQVVQVPSGRKGFVQEQIVVNFHSVQKSFLSSKALTASRVSDPLGLSLSFHSVAFPNLF
jgi:hypothetical protein